MKNQKMLLFKRLVRLSGEWFRIYKMEVQMKKEKMEAMKVKPLLALRVVSFFGLMGSIVMESPIRYGVLDMLANYREFAIILRRECVKTFGEDCVISS